MNTQVKGINPLMNFVSVKSKGNLQDDLAGNFSDVFNKASGQKDMELSKDSPVKGSTKVQVQKQDTKGLDDGNVSKTDSKEVKGQDMPADSNIKEEVQKAGEELVGKVAEELGVSEEEVIAAMEILGLTMADLLIADNMTQLVLTVEGEDMLSLMTDEGLYESLQNLLGVVSETVNQLGEQLGITMEDLAAIIEQEMVPETETAPEDRKDALTDMNHEEKPEIPEGQEDYTVVIERNGETVKVSVEVDGNRETESTEVTALKPQTVEEETAADSKKEEGAKQEGSSQKQDMQETVRGDVLIENLLNRSHTASAEAAAVENTLVQSTVDTQDIMNQIMDYMKVQVKADMTQMELQLNPASLGTVNINITSKAGVITAQFLTQNETVKAAIESQIVQLKNSFEEQGLKVEAVEVTVASHSFERNLNGDGNGQHQAQDGKRKGARRVNLNALTLDEGQETDETEPDTAGIDGSTVSFTA